MISAWVEVRNGGNRSVTEGARVATLVVTRTADCQGAWGG